MNGITGGNPTIGTISAGGLYTPPKTIPPANILAVSARSTAYPTSVGSATLTLTRPVPYVWSVSPNPVTTGQFSISLNGANFAADSQVLIGGVAVTSTYVSATRMLASSMAAAPGTVQVAVRQPAPGSVTSSSVLLSVVAANIGVAVAPTAASVVLGATQAFGSTVSGTQNTAVTWSVNGVNGGSVAAGTISSAGFYTAPAVMPSPSTVAVRVTSVASPAVFAQATVRLTSPPPPPVSLTAARFLEQSSFGPSPATLARVQQIGIDAYLDEQFGMPETQLPEPAGNGMGELRQWELYNFTTSPDQLRQRVAYTLSQIIVTSGNKLVYANEILPWMRLLSQHAFGNYRDLLHDVSMSPSMGKYLDLARSMKPGMAGGANENYPRELLQLFSVGT